MTDEHVWTPARHPRRTGAPFFGVGELDAVRAFYDAHHDAAPTPLHRLTGLARDIGLGDLLVKDETARFGLTAFKILGARYAVARLVAERGAVTDVACATAGNHGRAVAHAARTHGLRAHVYVPAGTLPATIGALAAEGAAVVVTDTGYDDTVRRMAHDADAQGWTVVSDTSWDGYEQTPRWIMAGYTRLMDEAASQWGDTPPHVVVVQAGVGSLAGAVAGWLDGTAGPKLVLAEPAGSACVQASLRAGRRVPLDSCAPTAMAGLRCAEVSPLAWRALEDRVSAAIGVHESAMEDARRRLASPVASDPSLDAGPSGACGVAAAVSLMCTADLAGTRTVLELGPRSRVMAIVTEGK